MSIQFDIAKQIIAETCPNRKLKLENIRLFADIIQPKKYQKGDIILNEGDICNCLFYIEKGFIRQHYLKHDKDVIEHLACEKDVVCIIRKSKFPQNPKRSVRFSGKRTKRSVQKRKARNTQKAETKVL